MVCVWLSLIVSSVTLVGVGFLARNDQITSDCGCNPDIVDNYLICKTDACIMLIQIWLTMISVLAMMTDDGVFDEDDDGGILNDDVDCLFQLQCLLERRCWKGLLAVTLPQMPLPRPKPGSSGRKFPTRSSTTSLSKAALLY